MKKWLFLLSLVIIISFMILYFCKSSQNSNQALSSFSNLEIRLASQYGLQYAPVYVTKELKLLEKYLPGIKVKWGTFGGGSAIVEALAGNHIDIGFMGIPPALIAIDKGLPVKIAQGISVPPNELMVNSKSLTKLDDFSPQDKIAVPGIGSIQHILLSMAAKKYLGNAHALDNNIITMKNPDAFSALLNKHSIVAHFTVMPYIKREEKSGFNTILSGHTIFGDASIISITTANFHNNPTLYAGFIAAFNEAIFLINKRDARAIKIIQKTENLSDQEIIEYLKWNGTNYSSNIYGLMGLANYMFENNYIKNEPILENYIWENASSMIGRRMGNKSPTEQMLMGNNVK